LPVAKVRLFEQFRVESPHNQLLAVASGAGIPAAVAYLGVLVGITRTLWRRVSADIEPVRRLAVVAVVAAGAGHLVTDSFMSAEVTSSWLFWTLAGAGVGIALEPAHPEAPVGGLPDRADATADQTPGS
jgi:O-antigen ligase